MSGGAFNYAYARVIDFADELDLRLWEFDKSDEFGEQPYKFLPATMDKLREIEKLARHTAALMREVEWLYSGDTGEDSFMRTMREFEKEWEER